MELWRDFAVPLEIVESTWNGHFPPLGLLSMTLERGRTAFSVHPMSWGTLERIVTGGRLELLTRSEEGLRRYNEFKEQVASSYASTVDLIMVRIFRCASKVNTEGKVEHVPPPDRQVVFVKNDFPYNLAPGIEHYLLWSTHDLSDEEIEAYLEAHPVAGCEARLVFVNPQELQSIPEIRHAHVLLKME